MPDYIEHFMWGYQHLFRHSVELLAKDVFRLIGVDVEPEVFLVGVRRPGFSDGYPVCVEPEDGKWPHSIFDGLSELIDTEIPKHPLQSMFYSHEPTMRDKPENIRRIVVTEQVTKKLLDGDQSFRRRSFVSTAYPVANYYVVCVLQIPEQLLTQFPSLNYRRQDEDVEASFLRSCIVTILAEARNALVVPEPGRQVTMDMRSSDEVVRKAASSFMRTPFLSRNAFADLFETFNALSLLKYEGAEGIGRLILAEEDDPGVQYVLKLANAVPLRQTRWTRKLLQMATSDTALIANNEVILGLGKVSDLSPEPYSLDVLGHHHWLFRRGDIVFLHARFGKARLPQEPISYSRFSDNVTRLFPGTTDDAVVRLRSILAILIRQTRGNMIVFAGDAEAEARRLALQGTLVEPTPLTQEVLDRACRIDGTILADPNGICYAIGVILDGEANDKCTPSRGARYNSAVRYVSSATAPRMAFVVSEDRTLDIIPLLRERASRAELTSAIDALTTAALDNYHKPRMFLDEHRFYLDAEQCRRVNASLDRIEALPKEVGRIVILTTRFEVNPEMNDGYLRD